MKKLLIVQIDGLSPVALKKALDAGLMPFTQSLLTKGYTLKKVFSGIPSTSPAGHMAILYGVNNLITGFRFYIKKKGHIFDPMISSTITDMEELALKNRPDTMAKDTSTVNIIYSANKTHSVSLSQMLLGQGRGVFLKEMFFFLKSPFRIILFLIKAFTLTIIEHREYNRFAGKSFPLSDKQYLIKRVMHDLIGAELSFFFTNHLLDQGYPIIYVNFPGYDDIAHYYGSYSAAPLFSLSVTDMYLRKFYEKADNDYAFCLVSDHGQTPSVQIRELTGMSLGENLKRILPSVKITEDFDGSTNPFRPDTDLALFHSGGLSTVFDVKTKNTLSYKELEAKYPDFCEKVSLIKGVGFVLTNSPSGPLITQKGNTFPLTKSSSQKIFSFAAPLEQEQLLYRFNHLFKMEYPADAYIFAEVISGGPDGKVVTFENHQGSHGGIGGPQTQSIFLSREIQIDPDKLHDLAGLQNYFIKYVYG